MNGEVRVEDRNLWEAVQNTGNANMKVAPDVFEDSVTICPAVLDVTGEVINELSAPYTFIVTLDTRCDTGTNPATEDPGGCDDDDIPLETTATWTNDHTITITVSDPPADCPAEEWYVALFGVKSKFNDKWLDGNTCPRRTLEPELGDPINAHGPSGNPNAGWFDPYVIESELGQPYFDWESACGTGF